MSDEPLVRYLSRKVNDALNNKNDRHLYHDIISEAYLSNLQDADIVYTKNVEKYGESTYKRRSSFKDSISKRMNKIQLKR